MSKIIINKIKNWKTYPKRVRAYLKNLRLYYTQTVNSVQRTTINEFFLHNNSPIMSATFIFDILLYFCTKNFYQWILISWVIRYLMCVILGVYFKKPTLHPINLGSYLSIVVYCDALVGMLVSQNPWATAWTAFFNMIFTKKLTRREEIFCDSITAGWGVILWITLLWYTIQIFGCSFLICFIIYGCHNIRSLYRIAFAHKKTILLLLVGVPPYLLFVSPYMSAYYIFVAFWLIKIVTRLNCSTNRLAYAYQYQQAIRFTYLRTQLKYASFGVTYWVIPVVVYDREGFNIHTTYCQQKAIIGRLFLLTEPYFVWTNNTWSVSSLWLNQGIRHKTPRAEKFNLVRLEAGAIEGIKQWWWS